jgi:hypothetical protein
VDSDDEALIHKRGPDERKQEAIAYVVAARIEKRWKASKDSSNVK